MSAPYETPGVGEACGDDKRFANVNAPPLKNETHGAVQDAEGLEDQDRVDFADPDRARLAEQALAMIDSRGYALAYLQPVDVGIAQPGELSTVLGFLTGDMLTGACCVIEKRLECHPCVTLPLGHA